MARRSRFRLGRFGVVAMLAAMAACSSKESRPAAAGDGTGSIPVNAGNNTEGGVDAGTTDSATDSGIDSGEAGACNDLANTGLLVDRIGVVGDPPVAQGGTVVDGNYDLTSYSVYVGTGGVAGPTGITAKASMRIAAGKVDEITELGGSGPTTQVRKTSAFSATGATFAETELCPNVGGGSQRQFTAMDPLLTLTDLTTKEAFTFTKR